LPKYLIFKVLAVFFPPTKCRTVETPIVMLPVVFIPSELRVPEMPNLPNPESQEDRRIDSPRGKHPRAVVIGPMIPAPTVKVEVFIPRIDQVIRNPHGNIHVEVGRIDELRCLINIDLRRSRRHIRWWRRRRRCGSYPRAVSGHQIPIGIHALNIGIVIPALRFPAIDLARSGAFRRPDEKPGCRTDGCARSCVAGGGTYGRTQPSPHSRARNRSGSDITVIGLLG